VFNSLNFAEESHESAQMFKETKSRLRDLIKELPEEQKQVLIHAALFTDELPGKLLPDPV